MERVDTLAYNYSNETAQRKWLNLVKFIPPKMKFWVRHCH